MNTKHPGFGVIAKVAGLVLVAGGLLLAAERAAAVGSWVPLSSGPPGAPFLELMLLMPDGTVMVQEAGSNNWYRLTPDLKGSYVNGQWSAAGAIAPMHYNRTYYSSQVLRDGRVFVAGGEYSNSGWSTAEIYDPQANVWHLLTIPAGLLNTNIQTLSNGAKTSGFSDSQSQVLPDGTVLVAPIYPGLARQTLIFNPVGNNFSGGAQTVGNQNEVSWVQLADRSTLSIDKKSLNSERYIPATGTWIPDAPLPVQLYSSSAEIGAGFLLPDGRAFFLGGSGSTAYYTPSNTTSSSYWTTGPNITNGLVAQDAPAAMMVNGKILCAFTSTTNHNPIFFYEFDSNTGIFAPTPASGSPPNLFQISDATCMLALPDGTVLFSNTGTQLYDYQPNPPPLAAGKPTISAITAKIAGVSYHLTGTKLNGISQGAAFGDDAQMDSNYPLVRLTDSGGNVYYARTYNWSTSAVATGSAVVSTDFAVPGAVPPGTYSLVAVANGNPSDPVSFTYNAPVWVDFNYFSPFGFYFGTFSEPYNTLSNGVSALASGGTIAIKPGSSTEAMTISKPMTITAVGGAATVGH
ncbi:MAG TPA: kelch repeat-containing protein [Candidatus Acidoferrum sp.]|nr:kelch repeat-containing protein [Candidatus Acidoferrum sp.]